MKVIWGLWWKVWKKCNKKVCPRWLPRQPLRLCFFRRLMFQNAYFRCYKLYVIVLKGFRWSVQVLHPSRREVIPNFARAASLFLEKNIGWSTAVRCSYITYFFKKGECSYIEKISFTNTLVFYWLFSFSKILNWGSQIK